MPQIGVDGARSRCEGRVMVMTVGVLTPHATAGPEIELPELAPVRVRLAKTSDKPVTTADELRERARPAVLDEAVSVLLSEVDVLAFASTGSGYALGYDAECALVDGLRERWGRPFYSTCLSTVSALRSREVERVSVVHPPWFGDELNDLGAQYFRHQGFEVVDARLADLPDEIQPATVVEWIAQRVSPGAQAIFLGGNGFRVARAVRPLERLTGCLVLEANQVLLQSILQEER
ncbi:hypothetical protein ACQHIV_09780 [Kribbella sp. GL6]|uniref:aspartate racemase/maleate isomerase family protein n=1 Tax=Kribbella sp. GL6 TaxID=3419765 RepID=UPI003D0464D4